MQDLAHEKLPERLKAARERAGYTQEVLAVRAGIGTRTLARIESGEDVRYSTLVALANALGVDVSTLVGGVA
jgi:transcriptional regulator with XRE-family HTH domain